MNDAIRIVNDKNEELQKKTEEDERIIADLLAKKQEDDSRRHKLEGDIMKLTENLEAKNIELETAIRQIREMTEINERQNTELLGEVQRLSDENKQLHDQIRQAQLNSKTPEELLEEMDIDKNTPDQMEEIDKNTRDQLDFLARLKETGSGRIVPKLRCDQCDMTMTRNSIN